MVKGPEIELSCRGFYWSSLAAAAAKPATARLADLNTLTMADGWASMLALFSTVLAERTGAADRAASEGANP